MQAFSNSEGMKSGPLRKSVNCHVANSLSIAVLALLASLTWPLCAQGVDGAALTGPRAQAEAFLAQARSWMSEGDLPRASSLASLALEMDPNYSECLYLLARVESADRTSTRAAIDHLRKAVRSATWIATDPLQADQLLTELLIRTGQVTEARKVAERLTFLRPEDPRNFVLLARADGKAGATQAERQTLTDALARFPSNDDTRLAAARLLQRQGHIDEASVLVRTGLQFHPDSPPLLLASAEFETDRAKRLSKVELFLAQGGADPLAAVLGMEAAPTGQRRKYLDLFLSAGGLSRQLLVARAVNAVKGNESLVATLQDSLKRYSGNRDLDADSEGLWEDRWVFDNGKVTRWIREPALDGVAQYEAEFKDGRPATFAFRDSAGKITQLTYSSYPFVERAKLPGERTLMLEPNSIHCFFLSPDFAHEPAYDAPRILPKISVPSPEALRHGAYQLEEFEADGHTVIRRVDFASGQPVFMEESTFGDGVLDHRVWYSGGQPERAVRSLRGDGVFQVKEAWKSGRLSVEAIDTNGDGIPDYRQSYDAILMKGWDFKEDGNDVIREYEMPDGTFERDLSTNMNGIFDLRIVFLAHRIVSFTKNGAKVPIVTDAPRGVTWIGQPPHSGVPNKSLTDCTQAIAGRLYFIFRFAGVVYAEAVQE
jgi:tetratricopeptide (TPR) repeat protein